MKADKLHRVFFALWPDESVRQQLSQAFQNSQYYNAQVKPYKSHNLHLTLHFMGNVNTVQLSCLKRQAESVPLTPFTLLIDRFGCFKKSKILWLGQKTIPVELNQLHQQLGYVLKACGYTSEERPYHPHITLMRKFNSGFTEQCINPIEWNVREFVLVESIQVEGGVEYSPLFNT